MAGKQVPTATQFPCRLRCIRWIIQERCYTSAQCTTDLIYHVIALAGLQGTVKPRRDWPCVDPIAVLLETATLPVQDLYDEIEPAVITNGFNWIGPGD
jgi:hypothetical protein